MNRFALSLGLISLAILGGCESGQKSGGGLGHSTTASLPGMRYLADEGWIAQEPGSQARAAQYELPAENPMTASAELIFYYFGRNGAGSIEANIERWAGQFERDDDDSLTPDTRTRFGLRIHEVAVEGRYIAEVQPGSEERHDKPGYAMRAAIIETAAGPYYVRLIGPEATMRWWESSWDRMLDSLRPLAHSDAAVADAPGHPQPTDN